MQSIGWSYKKVLTVAAVAPSDIRFRRNLANSRGECWLISPRGREREHCRKLTMMKKGHRQEILCVEDRNSQYA